MIAASILAVGAGAALQIHFLLAQSRQLADDQRSLLLQVSHFDALAGDLAAAQAGYVAPGQPNAPWIDRTTTLASQLATTVSSIRSAAQSADAQAQLQVIYEAMSQSATADANARASLAQEHDLMAADIVFGEGRDAIIAAREAAAALATQESAFFEGERSRVQQRIVLIAGGAAVIAAIGLLVMIPLPRRQQPEPALAAPGMASGTIALSLTPPQRQPAKATPVNLKAPATAPPIDLTAAADLCTALSRLDSAAALPGMLARASALLDASGVIVWMAAGNELFAATSHGYDPRIITRLGAIHRDADNATAAAWRTGEVRTVAGDAMVNGAIVAPMFAPDTCIGVLAAEVRHGREQDPAVQAVTTMIAAQLATVLGAWPAAPPARAAEA